MMGCANGKLEPETPQNNHLVEVYGGQRHGTRNNGQTVAYKNNQNRQVHQKKGVVPPPDGGQPKAIKKVTFLIIMSIQLSRPRNPGKNQ